MRVSQYVFYLDSPGRLTAFGLGRWAMLQRRPDLSAWPTMFSMSTRSVTIRNSVVWASTRSREIIARATVSTMCAHEVSIDYMRLEIITTVTKQTSSDACTHTSKAMNVSLRTSNFSSRCAQGVAGRSLLCRRSDERSLNGVTGRLP